MPKHESPVLRKGQTVYFKRDDGETWGPFVIKDYAIGLATNGSGAKLHIDAGSLGAVFGFKEKEKPRVNRKRSKHATRRKNG